MTLDHQSNKYSFHITHRIDKHYTDDVIHNIRIFDPVVNISIREELNCLLKNLKL